MNKNNHAVFAEDPTVDALSKLTTMLCDVTRGYKEMVERAEPDLRPSVQLFHEMHTRHTAELMALLRKAGDDPEETGSMMGAVHEAVATVRDWLNALDESAIDMIASGEERVLNEYKTALEKTADNNEIHQVIVAQRNELEAAHDKIKG
jgi:uncharacterized protein (TIGR02284 family)